MSDHRAEPGDIGRAMSRGYCYACPTPIEVGEMWRRERVGNAVPHLHRLVHHPECPPEPVAGRQSRHLGNKANVEDCPACDAEMRNLPYPFLCPASPGDPVSYPPGEQGAP